MSIRAKKKMVVIMVAAAITVASAGAFAQIRYDQAYRYDQRHDDQGTTNMTSVVTMTAMLPTTTRKRRRRAAADHAGCASPRRSANAGMKPA